MSDSNSVGIDCRCDDSKFRGTVVGRHVLYHRVIHSDWWRGVFSWVASVHMGRDQSHKEFSNSAW